MIDNERNEAAAQRSAVPRSETARSRRGRKRKHTRILLLSIGSLLVLIVMISGWLAYRAQQIRTSLDDAMSVMSELQVSLTERDTARGRLLVDDLRRHTAEARTAGTDPLWRAAALMPIIGPNFSAVTEVTVSADDVVSRAVAPILDSFESLDWASLTPADGRIDLTHLQDVAPTLSSAATTVQLSYERLADIDRSRLLPQVSSPLEQALGTMDEARTALNGAASAAEVLPPMLGADGPRTYLVLIQNSAEIRATGGISGAFALVRTNDGAIELVGQGSPGELGEFIPPLDVNAEQAQIYSPRIGRFFQSANLTPDFPTVARTTKQMYETRNPGTTIDGVMALDPVVLANILQVTGPIDLGDFEDPAIGRLVAQVGLPTSLTAENVVQTLLSDTYARIEKPSLQDAYFASVASRIFSALADGQGESAALVEALTRSSEEDRLFAWSNTSKEQDVIVGTPLGGAVTGASKGGAAFDVYFNDGTGAKMDYYVTRTVQVLQPCSGDADPTYTVRVTLTNTAPTDAAVSLPEYVTGAGAFGVPPGEVRTNVVSYGPAQSALGGAVVDGTAVPVGSFLHGTRPVGVVTAQLAPGETSTIEYQFTRVVQTDPPVLSVTPTIQPVADVVLPPKPHDDCK
jgi:hypothetical protein